MTATECERSPQSPVARFGRAMCRFIEWSSNFAAVLFNAGFSLLAIVTLCGIVFITRPQQVMHDIQPWMWLPLLVVMAPAQIYSQYLAWRTIFAGQSPSGPAIARRQMFIPTWLRPLVAFAWLVNFFIGFAIVVSLSKPDGGAAPPIGLVIFVITIGFWLAFAANIYLLLAIRTLTPSSAPLDRVWRHRILLDVAMAFVGAMYYRL